MLRTGILNPAINSLLSRVRHTNTVVIADRGFPFWPQIETVDLSLIDVIPTALNVVAAIRPNFIVARAFLAEEFLSHNSEPIKSRFVAALAGVDITYEAQAAFK